MRKLGVSYTTSAVSSHRSGGGDGGGDDDGRGGSAAAVLVVGGDAAVAAWCWRTRRVARAARVDPQRNTIRAMADATVHMPGVACRVSRVGNVC